MLEIKGMGARYGEAEVLHDVDLTIGAGEVVTLVGRNGAGKTTLLRCLMGLHPRPTGTVHLDGRDITRLPAHRRARLGLGYVPDDRGMYATLTVHENLTLPALTTDGPAPWPLERIYDTFPVLAARRRSPGTKLSGGEQQMLALARVLRTGARLLLCDEPTEGLAPVIVQRIGEILREAKEHGVAVLLVEQNLRFAATVADRHYLLSQGRIALELDNAGVSSREDELLAHLGL
ncbi:High-affinity branched-chain amino acid transport ATP-binding protein LivF [Streptomyces sp. RB5]|uniref:High-affinity branched-chain amino acid transport ATP-binding protein LivF n=1 Tax=Streptomyces smaragdinus TaxID=2585196 RepID=A0A7K0C9Z9_9ACTN|nr:ABC transporter ATP-binding protein [Streptomyces smaragdinus]MQY10287.1 High-affinity branched-chain amino acid transport ATP-binding protein LivF [Streptomyces smaragdinus]